MENSQLEIVPLDKNDMQVDENGESTGKTSNSSTFCAKGKYDDVEPSKGMVFESLDEAHQFYHLYAKICGFSVRIRNTITFPRSKEIRYRRFVCSCEGHCSDRKNESDNEKREKKTLTIRKGCPVGFAVSRKKPNGHWIAMSVTNEHNHVLASPKSVSNLRNRKVLPSLAKILVETFSETGLPTGTVPDVLNEGPVMKFSSRDCWNDVRNLRIMNLDSGDAESVFQYCIRQRAQDPNFYYSILPDKESRMVNFFWVDSRSQLYYERFGDVVVFDTTYKTNKYGMSVALFIGANNHSQPILFGCTLLQDETQESFEWLFATWLDAMNGKAPILILTDQDTAMGNAVKKVFPKTNHRLCLWHIMKKFTEKYGNLYKKKSPFKEELKRCLHQSITTKEFEKEWKTIMSRYNLEEKAWLQQIFDIQSSWVPVYNRAVLYGGMSTTRWCKSMHSFFDSFVHSGTTLREFVAKYEQALLRRYEDENREDNASKLSNPVPKIGLPVAEHAAKVYTRTIFNMFEDEVMESLRLTRKKLTRDGSQYTYSVSTTQIPIQKYTVSIDTSSLDASCECHLFEFKGILCRHILAIFQKKDVHHIPAKYILPRWTKEATDGIPIPVTREPDESFIRRTMEFHRKTNLLLPYLHESAKTYQVILDAMDKVHKKVLEMTNSSKEKIQPETKVANQAETEVADQPLGNNPQVLKTKGRKRKVQKMDQSIRLKNGIEYKDDEKITFDMYEQLI